MQLIIEVELASISLTKPLKTLAVKTKYIETLESKLENGKRIEERILLLEEKAGAVEKYKLHMDDIIEQKNNEIFKLTTDLIEAREMSSSVKMTMKTEMEALRERNDELQEKCRAHELKQQSLLSIITKSNQERDQLKNELESAKSNITQFGVLIFFVFQRKI